MNANIGAHGARAWPPVQLTAPSYYGTLAAVRSLGRLQVPVTTASPESWSISRVSKYTRAHLTCPPTTDAEAFLNWLEEFARQASTKYVLLPTCDDTAWLYARHRERLSSHFHLGKLDISSVHPLLHKGLLAEHALAVGLETPRTWFPIGEADLQQLLREATFPLLIKPVTQVLFETHIKGAIVRTPAELIPSYRSFSRLNHGRELVDFDPSVTRAIVQEYHAEAQEGIYNISGYARDGELVDARAGKKVLQRPRKLGTGLCFEAAPLARHLVDGIGRLTRRLRFSGVFEGEFVSVGARSLLIDFNPRFYNQMGFDVARGLPLPLLAYRDALEGQPGPAFEVQVGDGQDLADESKAFAHGLAFKMMIYAQRLSGVLSREEAHAWRRWYETHEGRRIDAVSDPDDVWPARLDVVQMLRHHLRHPRHFLRTFVLNG